jgi:hypothetical protein
MFSIISLIFGAKRSFAILNKDSKNRQNSSITLKQIDEKAGSNLTESFQNRLLKVDENNFINRSEMFQTCPLKSKKTSIAATYDVIGNVLQIASSRFLPLFRFPGLS